MHLTLVDAYNIQTEQTACDSYEWAGETLTESGVYEHTFTSIHGCDSIVTMNLTVNQHTMTELTEEACESYDWFGTTYTESGVYEQVLTSMTGCDSIVMLHLNIENAPLLETLNGDNEVDVRLTPVSNYMTEDAAALYTWSIEPQEAGSVNADGNSATVVWSETYKGIADIKVEASNNCGLSEQTLSVTVKNSTNVNEYGLDAKIYPNPTNGIVNIEIQGLQRLTVMNALGQILYDLETEGDKAQIEMAKYGTGTYLIRIYTESGILVKRVNVMQ